jgi:hypothetical protein
MKAAFYKRMTALVVLVLALAFTGYGQSAAGESPSVLIAGSTEGKPCYWLNGVRYDLGRYGSANAITVSSSDVYIAGRDEGKPCYWLNGVRYELPVTETWNGNGDGIAVSGSNVYVVGNESNEGFGRPCYWLNGVRYDLGRYGSASAIAVSGSNVYIAGSDGGIEGEPCYWLNGERQALPVTGGYGSAAAIAVSGSDVYIAGSDGGAPCYWLNGKLQALPVTGRYGYAVAIAVSGSDVYIAGSDERVPCYWLNGVRYDLGTYGSANAITVSSSDVYIAGSDGNTPCYWLNGVRQALPIAGKSGSAIAIALGYEALAPQAVQPAQQQEPVIYKVGDRGPAGGWIFYDKGAYSNEWRYLEAAPAETEFTATWGAWRNYINGIGQGIGAGKGNTRTIVGYLRQTGEIGSAAQLCDELIVGDTTKFDDWFLPSMGELDLMYRNLKQKGLGEFSDAIYWSSSQDNSVLSYWKNFGDGSEGSLYGAKNNRYSVRCARAF